MYSLEKNLGNICENTEKKLAMLLLLSLHFLITFGLFSISDSFSAYF